MKSDTVGSVKERPSPRSLDIGPMQAQPSRTVEPWQTQPMIRQFTKKVWVETIQDAQE